MLKPNEMSCDFFADSIKLNYDLPNNYVCIHAASTWPSRTWNEESFRKLTNTLNSLNISVIIVGKNGYETGFWGKQEKSTFHIEVEKGFNLSNKLSLHETWHVINNSICFITMDSGLLHLAGTTDTHIIQLGSSIDPILRAPFRRGSQGYKYEYMCP